ncbi:hypothetical protein BO70DRAFT_44258 [Aspergillus heteromorphus CBS 117.55]|uniref:CCHC-type domain-containing protein n=1 Tax=Aspergillus heteromorphus CBS 117.55 TaxID=1448321 RepID=A0A317W1F5_9EURO|nr:uncharacterized protein BO70DRAFT_44258 [Aspergillus heteromorphus CBS 117.55]PWY80476.1 hypothetical protein BO70DRAFT_44258 [Aspergillus heteromorphus CBS 117.55]
MNRIDNYNNMAKNISKEKGSRASDFKKKSITCFNCEKKNYIARDCRQKKKDQRSDDSEDKAKEKKKHPGKRQPAKHKGRSADHRPEEGSD